MNGKLMLVLGIVFLLAVGVFSVSRKALLPSEGAVRPNSQFKGSFPKPRRVTNSYQAVSKSKGIRLDAGLGKLTLGGSLPVKVYFNTGGEPIIGVALRITYHGLDVTATAPVVDPTLLATGGWACPVRTSNVSGGSVNIDFACLNMSTTGFVASTELPLLSFNLKATPHARPRSLVVTLDPQLSVMTRKSDADNILDPSSSLAISVMP